MALIGKIRENTWLLIVFIGLGLVLFIITSMFVGNQIPGLGSANSAGSIDGKEIDWTKFSAAEDALQGSGDVYAQRNAIWNFMIENTLVQKQADKLGFSVSEEELEQLQFGPNYSPIITARFTDPATRQLDFNQLNQIKQAIESGQVNPNYLKFWEYQKGEIVKDKLQSRMTNLVSKSIFTPKWMIEQDYQDKNQNATFNYVKIPFDEVDNSEVSISDADLKAYLADNKERYFQTEQTRKVDFVVFEVLPTAADTANMMIEMDTLAKLWMTSGESDTIFTQAEEGILDPRFFAKEPTAPNPTLTEALADPIFNANVGEVVGPVIEGNQMKIAKLINKQVIADSAKCRHILIGPNVAPGQPITEAQYKAAEKTVDSLRNLIVTGQSEFDSLVMTFSTDPGKVRNQGVYDWAPVNSYVPEFEEVVFRTGEIDKWYSVRTQFGVHLLQPLGRKFIDANNKVERVQIAVISRTIVPSEGTQEYVRGEAQKFMAQNRTLESLLSAANEKGMNIETTTGLKATDYIIGTLGSGQTSRDIVRWAFQSGTDVGDVAPEIYEYQDPIEYYDSKFVVAGLKNVASSGYPSVDDVRSEIEPFVYNLKKGELIKERITSDNLSALASNFSTKVDTASTVTFNSNFVANLGNEPKVVATAFNLEPNAVSAPIVGNSGVYVVQLTNKTTASAPSNIPTLRRQVARATQTQVSGSLIQSLKKSVEVIDRRGKFY